MNIRIRVNVNVYYTSLMLRDQWYSYCTLYLINVTWWMIGIDKQLPYILPYWCYLMNDRNRVNSYSILYHIDVTCSRNDLSVAVLAEFQQRPGPWGWPAQGGHQHLPGSGRLLCGRLRYVLATGRGQVWHGESTTDSSVVNTGWLDRFLGCLVKSRMVVGLKSAIAFSHVKIDLFMRSCNVRSLRVTSTWKIYVVHHTTCIVGCTMSK